MKCEEVENNIIDFLDNSVDGKRREEIEQHLACCERCMDEVKDFQHILKNLAEQKDEVPSDTLRMNFYHMLATEIKRQKATQIKSNPVVSLWSKPFMKIAAAIALLITGAFLGSLMRFSPNSDKSNAELTQLKQEVSTMKEMALYRMLNEESPSERIKAVNYAEEMPGPDENIIKALVTTLNQDKNVNVRLAAAYSLAKFTDRKPVRDSLVESLAKQTDPIIQIVLMNILVEKKETNAIKSIRKVMSDENTLKEVKDVGKKSIQILL